MMALRSEPIRYLDAGAVFSPCRRWRYTLWRTWNPALGTCAFIGLNPSVADEVRSDPTVTRCIGYARRWGCGRFVMLNAFALVEPYPKLMMQHPAPVSDPRSPAQNDESILAVTESALIVVAAWSGMAGHLDREYALRRLLERIPLKVLGWTQPDPATGRPYPRHPLYMRADVELQSYWHGWEAS
jgi:hypothetical protein